ncbi:hypothetical protein Tco_0916907 [Tanacetum coccineum]
MPWRHNDSSVADPLPGSGSTTKLMLRDYVKLLSHSQIKTTNRPAFRLAAGVSTTHEARWGLINVLKDSEGKVVTMAEFLRFPTFHGSKIGLVILNQPD